MEPAEHLPTANNLDRQKLEEWTEAKSLTLIQDSQIIILLYI